MAEKAFVLTNGIFCEYDGGVAKAVKKEQKKREEIIYEKPEVKVCELNMKALLGENGWSGNDEGRKLLAIEISPV